MYFVVVVVVVVALKTLKVDVHNYTGCTVCDEWSIELTPCTHTTDRLCIRTYLYTRCTKKSAVDILS